jgi:hypothetical protein
MKAHYRTRTGRMSFEIEGETQRALFQGIANVQEVFESDSTCGACGSDNFRFIVRTVEDNDFFELECQNSECRARLSFGQHKKGGTLFPRRHDEQRKVLPFRGWKVYQRPATPFEKDVERKAGRV